MAGEGYLFSKDLTQRTVNTIKKVSGTVTRASVPPARSRRGGGGKTPVVEFPFKMSLTKNDAGEQLVTLLGGRVFINNTEYIIESNSININGASVGTLYVYLKLAANWKNESDFLGYPILTVKETAENADPKPDIAETNFAYNSTKFPATDADNYFYSIGTIEITEKNGKKNYKLNQLAYTDSEFTPFIMNGFGVNRVFAGKGSDEEDDANYEVFVNGGHVVLPDGSDNLNQISETVAITSTVYFYLEIQGTQTENGGWENFLSAIVKEDAFKENTDDFNYFLIAWVDEYGIYKGFDGNFNSGGRIY